MGVAFGDIFNASYNLGRHGVEERQARRYAFELQQLMYGRRSYAEC